LFCSQFLPWKNQFSTTVTSPSAHNLAQTSQVFSLTVRDPNRNFSVNLPPHSMAIQIVTRDKHKSKRNTTEYYNIHSSSNKQGMEPGGSKTLGFNNAAKLGLGFEPLLERLLEHWQLL
jgi:hypothetical protein